MPINKYLRPMLLNERNARWDKIKPTRSRHYSLSGGLQFMLFCLFFNFFV
jgi:hypothetical protein